MPDLFHLFGGENRFFRFQPHRRVDLVGIQVDREQVRPRSDEGHQRHDEFLADRVDRRVRYLREELLEVVVKDLWAVRQHGQRRVVAHRADGFLAVLRHRCEDDLEILLAVTKGLLPVEQRHGRLLRRCRIGQRVERDARPVDPRAIRLGCRQRALQLGVIDDSALLGIDEQHLARLQAPFPDYLAFGNVEHSDLGGHDHVIVVGDDVSRRPEAVAVERGADLAAVGERHRRGPVPRLHQRRVVFVERAPVLVHQRIAVPGFRNHQHHRVRERVAAHEQELERVVE